MRKLKRYDEIKSEAELNVLKKELADIYRTLSLLKEEYDRLLKVAPDDRTAEQDKRIEYIDDLSKIRTIRKSEIELTKKVLCRKY